MLVDIRLEPSWDIPWIPLPYCTEDRIVHLKLIVSIAKDINRISNTILNTYLIHANLGPFAVETPLIEILLKIYLVG